MNDNKPTTMPTGQTLARNSMTDVEQLADSLSKLADQLHQRILRAVRKNAGSGTGELAITLDDAQTLLQDEMMLRQRANRLYASAASQAGDGLALPKDELIALAHTASVHIHHINTLKELLDLSTHLLAFANAALAAKPEQLIAAAGRIRQDVQAIRKETLAVALP